MNKEHPNLNEIQLIVCECINDNGGACHFDLIVHHVSKQWSNSIPTKYQHLYGHDIKAAVLATLIDSSQRVFKVSKLVLPVLFTCL